MWGQCNDVGLRQLQLQQLQQQTQHYPSPPSSCSTSLAGSTALGGCSCSEGGAFGGGIEDDDWPANPWQAQAEAHLALQLQQAQVDAHLAMQLKHQAEAQAQQGGGSSGGSGAVNMPAVLCNIAQQGQPQLPRPADAPAQAQERASCEQAWVHALHDLEGQVAFHEDRAARRDQELFELRACVRRLEMESNMGSEAVRQHAELEALRRAHGDLQSRNEFLVGIVSRFEGKTMSMERQIAQLTLARREAEGQATALLRGELQAAAAEASERLEAHEAAESRAAEELGAATAELFEQQQVSAEKQALAARELRELKDLNVQLVERLGQERSAHAKTRESLQVFSNENETLSSRVERLNEQLFLLADLNDDLTRDVQAARALSAPSSRCSCLASPRKLAGEDSNTAWLDSMT